MAAQQAPETEAKRVPHKRIESVQVDTQIEAQIEAQTGAQLPSRRAISGIKLHGYRGGHHYEASHCSEIRHPSTCSEIRHPSTFAQRAGQADLAAWLAGYP